MALTSVEAVKRRLSLVGETHDTMIGEIVAGVSSWLSAAHCHRNFERAVDEAEYLRGGKKRLQLRRYPIESISEIKQSTALLRDFDDAEALVAGEDFDVAPARSVEGNVGVVAHHYGAFYGGLNAVRVTYTGGYWTGDAEDCPDGAEQLPAALSDAATRLAVHLFQNRTTLGVRHTSIGSMDISEAFDGMPKNVREAVAAYVYHG